LAIDWHYLQGPRMSETCCFGDADVGFAPEQPLHGIQLEHIFLITHWFTAYLVYSFGRYSRAKI